MCETQNDLTGFHLFFIIVAICLGLTRVLNGVAQEISKSTSESNQKCCISKCDLNGALIWHRQLFDHLVCVLFKPQTEHFNRLSLLNGSRNENIASNKMDWKFVPSHLRDFLPAGSVAVVILRALIFHVTHIVVLEPKDWGTKTNSTHGGNHPQVIRRSSHCHYTLVCPRWFFCLFKTANECCYCCSWGKK